MNRLICKYCASCKSLNETSLLRMWVIWGEYICLEVYKIMLMIHPSRLCPSSNFIAYQFLKPITCAISMKVQIELFVLVFFLCDTCCSSQSIPTIFFPSLIFVMSLMCLCLKFINVQWDKMEPLGMLLSKYIISILHDFILDIMFQLFCIYFVCTCFFVDKYLCDIAYLEKLIHIRDNNSPLYILFNFYVLLVMLSKITLWRLWWCYFSDPCISLIICLAMPLTYPFGWAFYYGVSYLLLNH